MDEWQREFGAPKPADVGSLLRDVVDGHMARSMSDNQRAAAAWYRANGDRERAHTTGVFLRKPRVAGAAPILGVYVDSHAMATDFGVNKDIYLARLANVGFAVSGIDFLPSRTPRRPREPQGEVQQVSGAMPLPELTPSERAEVERLVEELPETLRRRAAEAVIRSKQRDKRQGQA